VGNIQFLVFEKEFVEHQLESHLARQEVADSEASFKLLKTIINNSAIIGEPVAQIEIEAIEVEAAKAAALKKLRQTIDVLNFFCDLVPFIMGHMFIPGESEKTFDNSFVRTEQAPILQFGSIPSGPLTQFSFVKLLESNVQYKLGYSKITSLLTKKQNKLEERLLSAIQWCGRATIAQSNEMAFLLFAISLESLILLDGGGAIVNRLSLRVAHLVGKSLTGRQTISSKVKGLYNIRSKIVHNGSFEVTDADLSLIRSYAKTCINELVTNEKFAGIDKQELVDWFDRQLLKTDN
jgi:hypothetical protein